MMHEWQLRLELEWIHFFPTTRASSVPSTSTSSASSPLGKIDVGSIRHISSRRCRNARDLGHKIRGNVFQVGLTSSRMQRRIVAQVCEIKRVGCKVRLALALTSRDLTLSFSLFSSSFLTSSLRASATRFPVTALRASSIRYLNPSISPFFPPQSHSLISALLSFLTVDFIRSNTCSSLSADLSDTCRSLRHLSFGTMKDNAMPECPARAVLPIRWRYEVVVVGRSKLMTDEADVKSMPRARDEPSPRFRFSGLNCAGDVARRFFDGPASSCLSSASPSASSSTSPAASSVATTTSYTPRLNSSTT